MIESHRLEPLDADVNAIGIVAARDLEILAARRAGADEYCVVAFREQRLETVDAMIELQVDTHVEDVADLFVEHLRRQSKLRNIGAHQSAGRFQCFEYRHVIAERAQIVGDGQRRTAGADQCDFLAVAVLRRPGQAVRDVISMIRRNALQSTDGDRLILDAAAATSRFTRSIADATENAREYVRLAIFHVRIAELTLGDHANVRGNIGMGRTAPLAINDLVVVIGIRGICWLHRSQGPSASVDRR